MTAIATEKLMTTEELLALPDDGMERWLVNGVLHEKYPDIIEGKPMTVRNRFHCEATVNVSTELKNWLRSQAKPRGKVLAGEAGVRLHRDPDLTFGVDIAYISAKTAAEQTDETTLIDGIPILVVEILSPSDTLVAVRAKVRDYLAAGVPVVWVIDPDDRMVRVYRPNAKPQFLTSDDEITAEPQLPGFRVLVANFFE